MDHEKLQSDLHALRQLYGLLNTSGHSLQNESPQILDQKARLFLRHLLDAASIKIFEAHVEVLAAQYSRPYASSSTQKEHPKDALKFMTDASNSVTNVPESTNQDLSTQNAVLVIDTWDSRKGVSQSVSSEQYKVSMSEPEVSAKRCRVCRRVTVKRPTNETKISELNKGTIFDNFCEQGRKVEEEDPISKEACTKIQQIELCFLASEVASKHVNLLENKTASQCTLPKSMIDSICATKAFSSKNELSEIGKFVIGKNDSKEKFTKRRAWTPHQSTGWHQATNQMTSQFSGMKLQNQPFVKTSKPLLPNSSVLNQLISENVVKNKGLALKNNRMSEVGQVFDGYKFSSQTQVPAKNLKDIVDKTEPLNQANQPLVSSLGSKSFGLHGHKFPATDSSTEFSRKTTTKTLVDHKSIQYTPSPIIHDDQVGPYCYTTRQKSNQVALKRLISQASESSISNSCNSSSWTSQQASTSYSDLEGYSSSSQSQSQTQTHHSGPTTSNEKKVYSGSESNLSSGNGESDMYSIPSRSYSNQVECDSNSDSQSSTPTRSGPTKNYRLANRKQKKRLVGRLRKLKDKLSIFFHHHHHHHHRRDDENEGNQQIEVRHGKSLWKRAGKDILDQRSKAEAYGEQSVKNIKKSVVRKVADKNPQYGHFDALVEGMLQHVRHAKKKPKPSNGRIRKPRNKAHHGRKQVVRKMHWWQMLRRRRGMDMPDKTHAKLGLGGKHPNLIALPETG